MWVVGRRAGPRQTGPRTVGTGRLRLGRDGKGSHQKRTQARSLMINFTVEFLDALIPTIMERIF